MAEKFYLTTTAPYVNASPHIGFALEIIQADAIARYKRLTGFDVFFNFGTDEHGQKIYKKALEANETPEKYVDHYAKQFENLKKSLNLSYDKLTRTTYDYHIKAAQEIWKLCDKKGFIKKGVYEAKYCIGCELEKQDSELVDGHCPLHPNQELEIIKEENYFFKFSEFEEKLRGLYTKYPDFVVPQNRLKEIDNFVANGLKDFSISRLKEKMPWGVPVPGDDKHVMYVWFDALTFYISTLGWPDDQEKFEEFWGTKKAPKAVQFAGKDNLRQQSAMWQAMLLAAGLPTSRQIVIHGFITSGGQKMSKSVGNVIDPVEYVEKYGTDALRYYLLAKINPFEDSDFTKESFEQVYQSDLANGLGNTIARVAKMAETSDLEFKKDKTPKEIYSKELQGAFSDYRFDLILSNIWATRLGAIDKHIDQHKPWTITDKNVLLNVLQEEIDEIRNLAKIIQPFLPETSEKILKQFEGSKIKSGSPLFPRLQTPEHSNGGQARLQ